MKEHLPVKELKVLNTIRGLAALMVLVSHYSNATGLFDQLLGKGGGQIGVMVFFVLSGFLISYLYFQREINPRQIKNYLLARVARVVPLYYVVCLTSFMLTSWFASRYSYPINGLADLGLHLSFANGKSLLWTIPVEIQYYVMALMLWYLYQRQRTIFVLLVLLCLLLVFGLKPVGVVVLGGEHVIKPFIVKSLPFFFVGAVMGAYYHHLEEIPQSQWWLLSIILLFVLYPNVFSKLTGLSNTLWYSPVTWLAISLFFLAWVFLVPAHCWVINNPLGDFFGKISYSLYLLHFPTLLLMKPWLIQSPAMYFPVYLLLVVALSWLAFRVVEKPAQAWLRGWIRPA